MLKKFMNQPILNGKWQIAFFYAAVIFIINILLESWFKGPVPDLISYAIAIGVCILSIMESNWLLAIQKKNKPG